MHTCFSKYVKTPRSETYPECYLIMCDAQGLTPTTEGFLDYIQELRIKIGYTCDVTSRDTYY